VSAVFKKGAKPPPPAPTVVEEQEPAEVHHGPSLNMMLAVFAALLGLTGLTVIVAYQDLGRFAAAAALGIAATKGTLVVLYFMHLRYASKLIALYAGSGLFFLAILLGITLGEVAGRPPAPRVDPLAPAVEVPATSRRPTSEEPP
jgi:cytochrome c oxidase subunit 4